VVVHDMSCSLVDNLPYSSMFTLASPGGFGIGGIEVVVSTSIGAPPMIEESSEQRGVIGFGASSTSRVLYCLPHTRRGLKSFEIILKYRIDEVQTFKI
jgi:hypothetical protein